MPLVDRRTLLAAGGAAAAMGAIPATAGAPAASGVLLFDPGSAEARAEAATARGQRLIALDGDPVRIWRNALAAHRGPVAGLTRWSDYVVLRSLAEERGLRIRNEERVAVMRGAMIVRWRMS